MRQDTLQGSGDPIDFERIDEEVPVADLAAALRANETPKLLVGCTPPPRRLVLEGAKRSELALVLHDRFHRGDPERTNQLVLEVRDTRIKAEALHVGRSQVGADSSSFQSALEVSELCLIAKARQPAGEPLRGHQIVEDLSDGRRPAHRDDGHAFGFQIPAKAACQRVQGGTVAQALDENHCIGVHDVLERIGGPLKVDAGLCR